MEILVLNAPKKLQEVVAHLPEHINLVSGNYSDIDIVLTPKKIAILNLGRDISTYDYVWITGSWSKRDVAYVMSLYLTKKGTKHSLVSEGVGSSKLVDMFTFRLAGLLQPKTYYTTSSTFKVDRIIEICGLPLVGKSIKGTRGRNSFLARTREELVKELKLKSKKIRRTLFFQEYIENDFDWGVMVGNGNVLSGERSYRTENSTTYMNHSFSGAIEQFSEISDIPKAIANLARKGHEVLGLNWGRADILVSKTNAKPYLLEVNRSPRMTSDSSEVTAYAQFLKEALGL